MECPHPSRTVGEAAPQIAPFRVAEVAAHAGGAVLDSLRTDQVAVDFCRPQARMADGLLRPPGGSARLNRAAVVPRRWRPGKLSTVPSRWGAERLRSEFKSFTRWVKVYERIHGLGGSNALQDYESMSGKALSAGVLPSRPMTANVYTVFIASTRSGIARTEVSVPAWRTTSVAVPAGSST